MNIMKKLACCLILSLALLIIACADGNLPGFLNLVNDTIMQADSIEIAKLEIINSDEVNKNQFHQNTIAGYPIKGKLSKISMSKAKKLVETILNPDSYANIMQRCKNNKLYGIRFRKGQNLAEFAYSQPCMQVFWLATIDSKSESATGVLGPDYSKAILELFR